ncbi:oxysterol-binding protein-related protein 10, partial [Carlito syrichta]|uniref:Oxysterol-binding protein-related protein 10 n=1 Tax=Carlito syrichta TaxID=1868482 RepID=A0A3Q0EDJ3_CARSF
MRPRVPAVPLDSCGTCHEGLCGEASTIPALLGFHVACVGTKWSGGIVPQPAVAPSKPCCGLSVHGSPLTRAAISGAEGRDARSPASRYFVLDFEAGILQYFVNEQSKHQKPRGALSLAGAIVSLSDEAPHMLVVYSANGEMFKLRAADAKERQFWVTQLRACAKYQMEVNSKSTPSSRSRSLTLLPHGTPNSASPCSQRHLSVGAPGVVTITHHKSPAAARRAKSQYSGHLHEVREMKAWMLRNMSEVTWRVIGIVKTQTQLIFWMMTQVEGQQRNLVHAIESLPGSGPLTALDQDLLLLKATSAATLSCLGECLSLLQQSVHQTSQPSHKPGASENILGWHGPKSHSTEQLKNGTLGSLPSASANITWAILPNSTEDEPALQPEPEPNSGPELVLSEDEQSDNEEKEETELGVMEDQRSVILHLISQLKLGMDLTKVGWHAPPRPRLCGLSPCPRASAVHILFIVARLEESGGEARMAFKGGHCSSGLLRRQAGKAAVCVAESLCDVTGHDPEGQPEKNVDTPETLALLK